MAFALQVGPWILVPTRLHYEFEIMKASQYKVVRTPGILILCLAALTIHAQQKDQPTPKKEEKVVVEGKPTNTKLLPPPDSTTEASVTVRGQKIAYRAVAGTITVSFSDAYDAMLGLDGQLLSDSGINPPDPAKPEEAPATARMFYAAYFKKDAPPASRPIMFLYNGGPGSSTMWLHMGSFGPRRVVTAGVQHPAGAPYTIVENLDCLLDVTDLCS